MCSLCEIGNLTDEECAQLDTVRLALIERTNKALAEAGAVAMVMREEVRDAAVLIVAATFSGFGRDTALQLGRNRMRFVDQLLDDGHGRPLAATADARGMIEQVKKILHELPDH
jgi:hypothetical protein